MTMFYYDSDELYRQVRGDSSPQKPVYYDELVKEVIEEVKPNYPQLCDYEQEWLYFKEHVYVPGDPVDLEYVILKNARNGVIYNTIPHVYKQAKLLGSTVVNLSSVTGEITIKPNGIQYIDSSLFKQTTYTISFNCSSVPSTNTIEIRQITGTSATRIDSKPVKEGFNQIVLTIVSSNINRLRFKNESSSSSNFVFNDLMIIEGDHRNENISYCDGLGGVIMPYLKSSNESGSRSNIVSCNEEVELHGVGNVQDELNLLTGELTQRIGIREYHTGDESNPDVITDLSNTAYKLTPELIKTVSLSNQPKPMNDVTYLESNAYIFVECPIVSTGEQTLNEINSQVD